MQELGYHGTPLMQLNVKFVIFDQKFQKNGVVGWQIGHFWSETQKKYGAFGWKKHNFKGPSTRPKRRVLRALHRVTSDMEVPISSFVNLNYLSCWKQFWKKKKKKNESEMKWNVFCQNAYKYCLQYLL